ncbi:Hypothetical predicted protein [Podarcis lilfordi]|uniref:Uncharacterized protein n=1 Tax=Podarcis lilfordi TaxID=74358 RepID=A0AA35PIS9_9SAUR|nr:Hypothetical predicted protein [Podarcis lilfordi]
MILLLGLCLCCIHLTRQETCPTPGTLTKPNIFLETSPSDEADEVLVKCQIPPVSPFTRIILCEDGVEIKSQKQKDAIFLYKFSYKISRASTRQLSCMYQNKDKNNQVNNSSPSDARNLYVSERGTWRTDFNEDFRIHAGASNNAGSLGFEISLGIIKRRATRHPERENQTQGQSVGSLNDESEQNPLHVYSDISLSPVSGIYCQAEAPKGILHPAYSHVSFKKRQEAHPALGRFYEEEV